MGNIYRDELTYNIGWNGAVTGTVYEQAIDEIEIGIIEVTDELILEVNIINREVAPYNLFEMFGMENYKIIDMNGDIIVENNTNIMEKVIDGKVNITIPLDSITNGQYKLLISTMIGSSKADQPLILNGSWECEITVK